MYISLCNIFRRSRPEVFCKKSVLRNFTKFTGKHLHLSIFYNKVAAPHSATLFKKRLWHRCFFVTFAKFLRTLFLTEHLWWLLLHFKVAAINSIHPLPFISHKKSEGDEITQRKSCKIDNVCTSSDLNDMNNNSCYSWHQRNTLWIIIPEAATGDAL